MKKFRRYLSTLSIIFLILLLVFQSKNLWLSFDTKDKNTKTVEDVNEFLKEILTPQRIVANLGDREHYMTTDLSEYWKKTAQDISEKLQKATSDNLKLIDTEEYLNLQKKKSIVFKFSSPLSGSVFVNLIGDNRNSNDINLSVDSIYISDLGEIYISGIKNFYKLMDIKVDFPIDDIIDEVKEKGIRSINFYEAYGIKKDIYIPDEDYISLQKVSYISGLYNLEEDKKSTLAERFLNVPIDYIREITVDGKNTYIYENEYLSLSYDGMIEYSLESLFDVKARDLNKSLNRAVEFIAQKTGISSGIYLEKIEPCNYNENLGYRFYFNLKDGQIPLVLPSKEHSFIEIDVYSEFVKNYREYYIRKDDNPIYKKEKIYLKKIHKIINKNKDLFKNNSTMDILNSIENLNLVYLIFSDVKAAEPTLAYEILYMGNIYYFDTETGNLMMVR
ncbi:hypothetical protein HKO22_08085 [Peptoniphilus sp. AGMB00490]|uniref:YycH protein n=2 Tax=Peptoniphilus TaxID=162289 RepID=A0A848RJN9_9FIRM|nr:MULTISPECIES: hypothetical protein [Peptoniphilus]NMW85693.1 hypothetical protein [Peptoniphilus faecalis]